MDQIKNILAEHKFFSGLEPQEIEAIAEHSTRINYNLGDFLMREDDPGTCFFLILLARWRLRFARPTATRL